MSRTHLTLAALATSAVEGLVVNRARTHSYRAEGGYDSAVLETPDGRSLIIRVPRTQDAETEQSADLIALGALTTGIRGRLPFQVPAFAGQAPTEGTRAVVYDFIPGDKVTAAAIPAGEGIATEIGRAIAAIHALPIGFVGEAGLPSLSAAECHSATSALIDAAVSTRLVPAALAARWREACDDEGMWQFEPVVIHGSLSADSFVIDGDRVAAVLGWSALRVDDPARDLHWLLGMHDEAAQDALDAYTTALERATDPLASARAMLYAELEIARWLLHGQQLHDQGIVDDAVAMLDGLVDRVHSDTMEPLSQDTGPILAVTDVEALLQKTPGDRPGYSPGLPPVADDQSSTSSSSE